MILFSLLIAILLIAFCLLVLYLVGMLLVYAVASVVALFNIATGRVTREQLAEAAAMRKEEMERKAEGKRLRKLWEDLNYTPPPCMENDGADFHVHIDINTDCSNIEDVAQGKC